MSKTVEFEHKIIPAQADEIAVQCAEVMQKDSLAAPMAGFLLNMSAIRGVDGLALIVWQDRENKPVLYINHFFDQRNDFYVGSLSAARHNLVRLAHSEFGETMARSRDLKGTRNRIDLGYMVDTAGRDINLIIPEFQEFTLGDPWFGSMGYIRDRLLSVVALTPR